MTELSPQAQRVLDAATAPTGDFCLENVNEIAAAALRAAAIDQNKQIDVPFSKIDQWEKIRGSTLSYWTAAQWGYQKAMSELLAIAAELEGAASKSE
jgi:hypothetical protein